MNNKNEREVILHGECAIKTNAKVPANAKLRKIKGNQVIIADSETTGNHHVVDVIKGVEFFDTKEGVSYMKNSVPTKVRCVMADRHDEITLEAGTYEFGIQQEYDYFEQALRNVRD
jgi:hypothetical protein